MFKKFNWGLTRSFPYSWPILGFSSLRSDYALVVQCNVLVVKVIEKLFSTRYSGFTKLITLSHILVKHLNAPKYLKDITMLLRKKKLKKKHKKNKLQKKKRYTKKRRARRSFRKRPNIFNLTNNKDNRLVIVEIFYSELKKFKHKKIRKVKYSEKFIERQKSLLESNNRKFVNLGRDSLYHFGKLTRYYINGINFDRPRKRVYSPYLRRMAKLAFSYYKKKVVKKKKVKPLRRKYKKFLRFKKKDFALDNNFELDLKIKCVYRVTRLQLIWKAISSSLRKSFLRFNLNVLPVFRIIPFVNGGASFFGNCILKTLKTSKRPQIFRAVYPVINKLLQSNTVEALKIIIKGRFSRNSRATKKKFGFGFLPYGSMSGKIDHSLKVFNAKFGSTSIRVLVKYAQ